MKHEDIIIKAKASISWIYSNLLGEKANFELLHPTELKRAEKEYVAWISYLLPIEQAIKEFEELKAKQEQSSKDVARFMVLLEKYIFDTQTTAEMHERWALEQKFKKVGKEE